MSNNPDQNTPSSSKPAPFRSLRPRGPLPLPTARATQQSDECIQVSAPIHRGNWATIFPAWYPSSPELKFILKQYKDNETSRNRWRKERDMLRQCTHPNIVKLYVPPESSKDNRQPPTEGQILLELMDRGSLKNVLDALHNNSTVELRISLALGVAVQALLGLQLLHSMKIIHRDVKPENLLVHSSGRVKWCDLEICADRVDANTITGTEIYMAPELTIAQGASYGPPVDIWGLGLVLYRIVQGHLPAAFCGMPCLARFMSSPDKQDWIDEHFVFPDVVDPTFRDLVSSMIQIEPPKRPSAFQLLSHPALVNHYGGSGPNACYNTEVKEINKVSGIQVCTAPACEADELENIVKSPLRSHVMEKFKNILYSRQTKACEAVRKIVSSPEVMNNIQHSGT